MTTGIIIGIGVVLAALLILGLVVLTLFAKGMSH